MKITIPKDYHQAFQASILIAKLIEQGKFTAAFDSISFSEEAKMNSIGWGSDLSKRREILQRCETLLGLHGYKPEEEKIALLDAFAAQVSDKDASVIVLTVTDKEAQILADALESYTRLSLGQVDEALDDFSYGTKPGVSRQDSEVINEMRLLAITTGGASFGITNSLLPDDARTGWMAKKVIDYHLAYKHRPEGGVGLRYDKPMRIGSCSDQDITIDDPELNHTRKIVHVTPSGPAF
ncbi:hypothetical protein [Pseudomonas serbica]|uniref:hypothetical protein n=1 Tax=Pseudomonas serbica TaxID=2965074 RepID=UPI00237BEF1F|nr:hypothetical protein [Pseudomonas serbica]